MTYQSTSHAKFLLKYHLIFICKYRHNLLDKLGDIIKRMLHKQHRHPPLPPNKRHRDRKNDYTRKDKHRQQDDPNAY